jgi:hypothetical protein
MRSRRHVPPRRKEGESAGRLECRWQRDQLPEAIRELVLDDQWLRNDICWSVFHMLRAPGRSARDNAKAYEDRFRHNAGFVR